MRYTVLLFLLIFLFYSQSFTQKSSYDLDAYVIYNEANELYKIQNLEKAKVKYLEIINKYPLSQYVPYALFMLSVIETDYIKIIDYLTIIKSKYPDFKYYSQVLEKLGDIYYIVGNRQASIDNYIKSGTDKGYYMAGFQYSQSGLHSLAITNIYLLLSQTKNLDLAYKGFMVLSKCYFEMKNYSEMYNVLREAVKLIKYAYDNGARLLYDIAKYYFYRKEVVNHFEKSLYAFSLLKVKYPLSIESSLSDNFIDYLKKQGIVKSEVVGWVAEVFDSKSPIPYKTDVASLTEEIEERAEKVSQKAENLAGNVTKADVVEYVIRIGEYKDLGVANLVAVDIARNFKNQVNAGIFYRDGMYFAEIRGLNDIDKAKEITKKIMEMGYTETKIIEVVKVIEYKSSGK